MKIKTSLTKIQDRWKPGKSSSVSELEKRKHPNRKKKIEAKDINSQPIPPHPHTK